MAGMARRLQGEGVSKFLDSNVAEDGIWLQLPPWNLYPT
jgi:hypothetical protein